MREQHPSGIGVKSVRWRYNSPLAALACFLLGTFAAAIGSEPRAEKPIDDERHLVVRRYDDTFRSTIVIFHRGEELQRIEHDNPEYPPDVVVEDYNFDGHRDVSLFGSMGAATMFREVYLFDPEANCYTRSDTLSDLPCITTDTENQLVVAACFHNSACENWQEAYAVTGFDNLTLVRMWGTRCGPVSESHYEVYDIEYENGNVVTERRTRHSF